MYILFMGFDSPTSMLKGADSCAGVYDKLRLAKDAAEELTEAHGFTWWQIATITRLPMHEKEELMIVDEMALTK